MREPNPPIELDDLPTMKAQKEGVLDATSDSADFEEKVKSKSAIWPAITVLIITIVCLALWNHHLQDKLEIQQQQSQLAFDRISELEKRLSTTGESMNQSSVSLQVKLKELANRTDDLWAQMDKLWASAWRRNQKEIADHTKSLGQLKLSLTKVNKVQSSSVKQVKALQTDLTALNIKLEELSALDYEIAQNTSVIKTIKSSMPTLKKEVAQLKKQVADNKGWVESNMSFRKQTNQKLDRLEQQVHQIKPVSL